MEEELEEWFIREILSHEAALTRYIARAGSNAADTEDLRQEVYIKVLQAAEKTRPLAPRFFLFTVAKNLLTDYIRRHRIVPIDLLQDCEAPDALLDEISPERRAGSFQQIVRLVDAFEHLPNRCRQVVWLRKIEDLSQKAIAERLNIAEGTVELHMVRGMRLLTQLFYSDESDSATSAGQRKSPSESKHGK